MASDLLAPTLQDHQPRDPGNPPWRLGSQVYVAILGGVLAVTPIAWLNSGKLGMPTRQRWMIAAAGAAGVVALIVYGVVVVQGEDLERGIRLGGQLIGVAAWAPMFLLQRSWDRVYSAFAPGQEDDENYESLWGPGFVAVLAGGLLQGAILAGFAG